MENKLLRLLDANFNRAKEALRVAEDISRFILNRRGLTARFKKCRHELSRSLLAFPVPYLKILKHRDSKSDVGRDSLIRDKKGVRWQDLMIANMKRAQESLRVLEECAKILAPRQARKFQRLRFECYELEKQSLPKF